MDHKKLIYAFMFGFIGFCTGIIFILACIDIGIIKTN